MILTRGPGSCRGDHTLSSRLTTSLNSGRIKCSPDWVGLLEYSQNSNNNGESERRAKGSNILQDRGDSQWQAVLY